MSHRIALSTVIGARNAAAEAMLTQIAKILGLQPGPDGCLDLSSIESGVRGLGIPSPSALSAAPFAPPEQHERSPKLKTFDAICRALGVAITVGSQAILKAFESAPAAAKAAVAEALLLAPTCNAGALLASLKQFLLVTDALPEIVQQQASVTRAKCVALGLDESETRACIASNTDPAEFMAMKGRRLR